MGFALARIALAMFALADNPRSERAEVAITYTVRILEMEGVEWRQAVFARLTPVTRQGPATVWTATRDVRERLIQNRCKDGATHILQAPRIIARTGVPAHMSIRSNRQFVSQVAWNGEDSAPSAKPEKVRTGCLATMTGRKIDQGILIQLVLEDCQIRAVHRVSLGRASSPGASPGAREACCEAERKSDVCQVELNLEWSGRSPSTACAKDASVTKAKAGDIRTVDLEIPEIGGHEIAGEWLIPNDGILLVSFGPHTAANEDGKAVVRERLGIIEAEAAPGGVIPAAIRTLTPLPVPRPEAPDATALPQSLPAPVTTVPMPVPKLPARSIPQGVHADGKPAGLPPLPPDEHDEPAVSTESSEPRPSPQLKKQQQARPASDQGMNKAEYTAPKLPAIPSLFIPSLSAGGLQFLVPITPFSLKLPFQRKLEIEVYGRIVPDVETRAKPAE
jgi:hypothetical protein